MAEQKNDTETAEEKEERVVKHTVKDSVFTSLFKEKRYLIQLYRALHPEDTKTTEDDLKDVTVSNVLVDDIYNDLGFTVGTTIMLLIEVQSTWTVNIIFRALMYLVQTYREYFRKTKQNLYKSKKLKMPRPEIYVIYVGDRKTKPEEISLSREFFEGKDICIDVRVKMIYDGKNGDIINQYVIFTKVCNEQVAIHGRTREAVQEAIRICKERNVLKEYLSSREKEVVDMLMELYDEQEVLRSYVESEKHDMKIEMAKEMLIGNEPVEKIVRYSGLSKEAVLELQNEQMQPV